MDDVKDWSEIPVADCINMERDSAALSIDCITSASSNHTAVLSILPFFHIWQNSSADAATVL